jgi:hypothetical protein
MMVPTICAKFKQRCSADDEAASTFDAATCGVPAASDAVRNDALGANDDGRLPLHTGLALLCGRTTLPK